MLHIIDQIRRRYPRKAGAIITTLALLSVSALALGVGVLLM